MQRHAGGGGWRAAAIENDNICIPPAGTELSHPQGCSTSAHYCGHYPLPGSRNRMRTQGLRLTPAYQGVGMSTNGGVSTETRHSGSELRSALQRPCLTTTTPSTRDSHFMREGKVPSGPLHVRGAARYKRTLNATMVSSIVRVTADRSASSSQSSAKEERLARPIRARGIMIFHHQ